MQLSHKLILLFVAFSLAFSQGLKSPIEFDKQKQVSEIDSKVTNPLTPMTSIVKFYQKTLSQIKGENCRMHPTCSQFSLEALQQYGIKGVFLSADRLHRCGHDLHLYRKVIVNGKIKYLDMTPKNTQL